MAIGRNDLCERFGQAVTDVVGMTRDGINQADRVVRGDVGCWRQSREKWPHVEGSQFRDVRRQQRWINSGQIGPDCIVK